MAQVTFAGLGSGFDSNSLITSMVSAEKQPETAFKQSQSDLTTQISTLGTLVSKLQALGDAATALNSAAVITTPTATSSDATRVAASASTGAVPGSYQIAVSALATAQTNISTGYLTNTAGVAGAGSFTVGINAVGGVSPTPIPIAYSASDTLDTIAARINSDPAASKVVQASVVFDGTYYRLALTTPQSGLANAVVYNNTGGTGLGFDASNVAVSPAGDAAFSINGVPMTRPSNSVSDAVTGVTFSLNSVTPALASPTRVDVAIDPTALEKKAQSIVDAYNSIATLLHGQLDYNGAKLGSDTLFGDSTASGMRRMLSDAFASAYSYDGTNSINASALGISTQSDGTLAISDAKFKAAIAADPTALQHVLLGDGSAGAGLVGALNSVVKSYTQYGTGMLLTEQTSKQTQIKGLDGQITRIENRAASLETSLRSQFAALDALESSMTAQTSYITSLFPTTNSNG